MNLWQVDADHVSVSTDETTAQTHLAAVLAAFGVPGLAAAADVVAPTWPSELVRSSDFLTHPVFHTHHS